eukprot:m.343502 g.343502  ORF g.343502 m.343502 type:complete len:2822 (-) comp16130_c0_seq1:301-8766(-)
MRGNYQGLVEATSVWSYVVASDIGSVLPNDGAQGTYITIRGSNLLGTSGVLSNVTVVDAQASVVSANQTTIVVQATARSAGVGAVVVRSADGALTIKENAFTYLTPAVITSVSPASGQVGTSVTISGSNLLGGATGFETVTLAGVEATLIRGNNTYVEVVAANSTVTSGPVYLETTTGSFVNSTQVFTYLTLGSIASVSPVSGQFGTRVTLTGTNLLGGGSSVAQVLLNNVSVPVVSHTSNKIVVTNVANEPTLPGPVTIISNTDAVVTGAVTFQHLNDSRIASVSPASGQIGTRVTLLGERLLGGGTSILTVLLNTVAANIVSFNDSTIVVVANETILISQGDVVVTADTGARALATNAWTHLRTGAITFVNPLIGQVGTIVTIQGQRLHGGGSQLVDVVVGNTSATILSTSVNEVVLSLGDGPPGPADLLLIADTGAIVFEENGFTYLIPGEIDVVRPAIGQRGSTVHINGTNLFGNGTSVAQVLLAGTPVTTIDSQNSTDVFVTAANSSETQGDVVIVSNTGATVTAVNAWNYTGPSVITSVSPASGQFGTVVTIRGQGMFAVVGTSYQSVTLGDVAATILSFNDTQIIVRADRNTSVASNTVAVVADSGAITSADNVWTYLIESQITAVEPAFGQLNTRVTIFGSRLLGGDVALANVTLGGVLVSSIESATNDEVVVVAAASSPQTGDVIITAQSGAVVSLTNAFEYRLQSNITSVFPGSGQAGTVVVLTGTDLLCHAPNLTSVTLNGVEATILSAADNEIVVRAINHTASTGDVVVTALTGATATAPNSFTYIQAGEITQVNPTSGQYRTHITITGTNLLGGGNNVSSVSLNGRTVFSILEQNNTQIVVSAAAGPSLQEVGDVIVVADTGATIYSNNSFTYLVPGRVQSVFPSSGRAGTQLIVAGVDLCGGGVGASIVNATILGIPATVLDGGCGLAQLEAGDFGANATGDIVLIADTGAHVIAVDGFTYIADGAITSVSPPAGQENTIVTIRGERLLGGGTGVESVTLAGIPATIHSTVNDTLIVVRAPPGTGTGDIVVTGNSGATTRLVNGWTYSSISSISPTFGQRGTVVTISGIALLAGASFVSSVELNGVDASQILFENSTTIVVVAHFQDVAGDTTGDVQVTLDNDQQITAQDLWTYKPTGTISNVSPASGQYGTRVVISGVELFGYGTSLVSVTLAGVEATITSQNSSVVEVVASSSASALLGDVILTSDTGATVILSNGFTYVAPQNIDAVTPSQGQLNTRITIDGTSMLGGGAAAVFVSLAGIEATIESSTNTRIVVVAAASNATSAENVTVVADTGATVTLTSAFAYGEPGVVTSVFPASGQHGTVVDIAGDFLRASGNNIVNVTIAGIEATIVAENDTDVQVVVGQRLVGSGASDIVLTADSGATVTEVGGFEYLVEGSVLSVSPTTGQYGTVLNITGTLLLGGGASIAELLIGGVAPLDTVVVSDELIQVVLDHNSAGASGISIVSDTGAIVTSTLFTYLEEGVVTSALPSSGRSGTLVVLSGTGMLGGGASVVQALLGADEAVIQSSNDSAVVVVAGEPSVVGTALNVTLVSSSGAIVSGAALFTALSGGVISDVSPSSGQLGTVVNITGTDLMGGASTVVSVTLSGTEALSIVGFSETLVTVVVNSSSTLGVGDIVISTDTGAVTVGTNVWEQLEDGAVATVLPTSGQFGTVVTLRGTNLLGGGSTLEVIRLGGVEVASVESENDTEVVVVCAGGSATVGGDVELIADTGATITLSGAFDILAEGIINSVTPNSGLVGAIVEISGTSLLGGGSSASRVSLAGLDVEAIVSSNASTVVVRAGNGTGGVSGDVVIVSDSGAVVTLSGGWTYTDAGVVLDVTPSFGQLDTVVTVSGTRLLGDGTTLVNITLSGVEATVVSFNATEIVVVAGGSSAVGVGDVVITSETGGRVVGSNAWEYRAQGEILQADPTSGNGGTVVLLLGTNLQCHSSAVTFVSLAGVQATILSESNLFVRVEAAVASTAVTGDIFIRCASNATITALNAWSYVDSGVINTVVPASGQFGTFVTISGTGLLQGGQSIASVRLAGYLGDIVSFNDTRIVVSAPAGPGLESTGDVVVTSDSGASVTATNAWTHLEPGSIDLVLPSRGQAGSVVTLFGRGMLNQIQTAVSISLAGINATISSVNDTRAVVTANARPSAGVGDIVIVLDSGAQVIRKNAFTYATAGNVTSVTPGSGQYGTVVTINGTSLFNGGTTVSQVMLGGTEVVSILSATQTSVVVVSNSSTPAGAEDVVLYSDSGAPVTSTGTWEYLAEGAINTVVPASGQYGTVVEISGERLRGGGAEVVSVTLAGLGVAMILSENDTTVVVVADTSANGMVGHVVLTSDSGAVVTAEGAFEYLQPGVISSVGPITGQEDTIVRIYGERMLGGGSNVTNVTLGGVPVANVLHGNDTVIAVVAAPSTGFSGADVVVVSDSGSVVTGNGLFTYIAEGEVQSVLPAVGQYGTVVTLRGERLLGSGSGLTSVLFGAVNMTIVSANASTVVVVVPESVAAGAVNITLRADTNAVIRASGLFSFAVEGSVDAVVPSSGQVGTEVVISGTSLRGSGSAVVSVTLAGVSATIVSEDDASVTVVASNRSAGSGDVVLVADSGAIVTEVGGFTYTEPGVISNISPAFGQAGTIVTITGTNMLGGAAAIDSVFVAGVQATVTSATDNRIVAVLAASNATNGTVLIVASTGAFTVSDTQFEYLAPTLLDNLSPAEGQLGTFVNIYGENFLGGGSSVTFISLGGVEVWQVLNATDSFLSVRAGESTVLGIGDLRVVSDTGAEFVAAGVWTYDPPSNITAVCVAS